LREEIVMDQGIQSNLNLEDIALVPFSQLPICWRFPSGAIRLNFVGLF
jgi:hypothetical protein